MTQLRDMMEAIEDFSFNANGKEWGYAETGFKLLELDYSWKDDAISFVLENEEEGMSELWEICDALEVIKCDSNDFTVLIYKDYKTERMMEGQTARDIMEEIRDTIVTYTPETHTI